MNVITALPGTVRVVDDPAAVAAEATELVAQLSSKAIRVAGRFAIALAGGSTPRQLYQMLATEPHRSSAPWSGWEVFFGDERACPPTDPASNFHMAETTLLNRVPIPQSQVHRMPAEREDLDAAALEYSDLLVRRVGDSDLVPRLDCVLLGLGENGHTASLFPATAALQVNDRYCAPGLADYPPYNRLTLTYPALNAARFILFLVTGSSKGQALRDVINGVAPAAAVRPTSGTVTWLLDRDAALSADG